jgi:ABC-type nitrate/sulfonate/bicarbonate transport system substrate-binding protein
MKLSRTNLIAPRPALRLGFVPLTDCAPLVMAHELGLFRKYGVRALLSRELGWATIRDKIIHGELDAAHAVAGMPVAATLGLKSVRCDCVTALVLNLHGNAITLSRDLWRAGVRDGATLCQEIRRARRKRPFTFGAVYSFSSHYYLLRNWLTASGVDPDRDARIVIVPPPQMVLNLKAGHLDGFCVGELRGGANRRGLVRGRQCRTGSGSSGKSPDGAARLRGEAERRTSRARGRVARRV